MSVEFWKGGDGNWSNPQQWTFGKVPGSGDIAVIQPQTDSTVTIGGLFIQNEQILVDRLGAAGITLNLNQTGLWNDTVMTVIGVGGEVDLNMTNNPLYGMINDPYGNVVMTVTPGAAVENYGRILAASQEGQSFIRIDVNHGFFGNMGGVDTGVPGIEAGQNGEIMLEFGGAYSTPHQSIWNVGIIQADSGGTVAIRAAHAFTTSFGTFYNYGNIDANGGTVEVDSDMTMIGPSAVAKAENGGTLVLDGGATSGGTIQITNATLQFGLFGRSPPFGPLTVGETSTPIEFLGAGTLSFGQPPQNITIKEAFNEAAQTMNIQQVYQGQTYDMGTLHLAGSHYSAADFQVQGMNVVYTPHCTA